MSLWVKLAFPALVTTSAGIGINFGVIKKPEGSTKQNQAIEQTQQLDEKKLLETTSQHKQEREVPLQIDQKESLVLTEQQGQAILVDHSVSRGEGPSLEAIEARDAGDSNSEASQVSENPSSPESTMEVEVGEEDSMNLEDTTSSDVEQAFLSEPVIEMDSGERDLRSSDEEVSPSIIPELEERGNCEVIHATGEMEGEFPLKESEYISVSCSNSVGPESILSNWTGFFPKSWFSVESRSNLSLGRKLDIEIEELDPEGDDTEPFKTVFKSEKFVNKSMMGIWGNEDVGEVTYKEEKIYEILLEDKKSKFYLYSQQ